MKHLNFTILIWMGAQEEQNYNPVKLNSQMQQNFDALVLFFFPFEESNILMFNKTSSYLTKSMAIF